MEYLRSLLFGKETPKPRSQSENPQRQRENPQRHNSHWGVYVGDGNVVHLSVPEGTPGISTSGIPFLHPSVGEVKKEPLAKLVEGGMYRINNKYEHKFQPRPVEEILSYAEHLVGRWRSYGFWTLILGRNCEEFAVYLRYRERMRGQEEPEPGDMIEIVHQSVSHWVLYVGGGNVVHMTAPDGASAPIKEALVKKEQLSEVVGEGSAYGVNNKYDQTHKRRPGERIVRDAEALVGKRLNYDAFVDNCEHFVTNLRYGVRLSGETPLKKPEPGDLIEIFWEPHSHSDVNAGDRSGGGSTVLGSASARTEEEWTEEVEVSLPVTDEELANLAWKLLFYLDLHTDFLESYHKDLAPKWISISKQNSLKELKPGDLVEISKETCNHWGIYVGDGDVIHSAVPEGADAQKALVKKEPLTRLVGQGKYRVNRYDEKFGRKPMKAIVSNAETMLGQQVDFDPVTSNSEHFATKLRHGFGISNGERVPEPGDLIEFVRESCNGLELYSHFGVCVGDGKVVHVTGTASGLLASGVPSVCTRNGVMVKEDISKVAGKGRFFVNTTYDETHTPRPKEEIVREAEAMVGQRVGYNLFTNNCEHMATQLRYGKPMSRQVIKGLTITILVVVTVSSCAVFVRKMHKRKQNPIRHLRKTGRKLDRAYLNERRPVPLQELQVFNDPLEVSASPGVKEEPLSAAAPGRMRRFNMYTERYKPREEEVIVGDAEGLVAERPPLQLSGYEEEPMYLDGAPPKAQSKAAPKAQSETELEVELEYVACPQHGVHFIAR